VFDIGFSEIVVIGVVALIVIGPERLQRYVNEVKADINREMELDELRKLQSQVQSAAREIEQSVSHAAREMESGVRSVESELNQAGQSTPAADASTPASPPAAARSGSGAASSADSGEASRQATLPGIERI
jgi:sec-independent protein translocase protein TatB